MTTATTSTLPLLLVEVEVVAVERLSPSFVRVELASPALADFGTDGPRYDLDLHEQQRQGGRGSGGHRGGPRLVGVR